MSRREFLRVAAAGGLGVYAGGCAGVGGLRWGGKRPNILYLMADQFRGDCMGCAGNEVIKTPHLDSIAKEGVVFSKAYTSTPSCTPARSGILTGLSPWHHGMLGYGRVAQKYPFELGYAMRQAGYYLGAIGKMHWFPQKLHRGYHELLVDESGRVETKGFVSDYRLWFQEQAADLNPDATGIGWNDYRARAYALPERLHPTVWTGQQAVKFIEEYHREEPFLLKVSFARPHSPYDPPQRFMDMYREEDMPEPMVGEWAAKHGPHKEPPPAGLWRGDLGIEQAKRSRRGYYGSVSFIDEQIGKILKALKKRGMMENTLIVFFADHGDMLGDHNLWRKTYAYEGSARVPMLLRWPRGMGMKGKRGSTIDKPVELRDILPTFLDAAGAEVPGHLDGESMLRLVRGEGDWREYIDLEHDVCYSRENHWNGLTDGKFKYIFHAFDGSEQLFDMRNDPDELCDLAGVKEHEAVLELWRGRMVEHLSERGEEYVREGKLVVRPKGLLYSPLFPKAKEAKKI
ncbi:MAG: arylsulfatase [Sedimentisphaerales bacterium]|nr:arylsulfatase [Sedimentisphaerales bacterium]